MIRRCDEKDIPAIFAIVNDAAMAYKGIIPEDRWHTPYMPMEELYSEIDDGVIFWGVEEAGELLGVMGIQDRGDVTLMRHAYVRTSRRQQGIGSQLLRHLEAMTELPILIGTWTAATWALNFYQKNGYTLLNSAESSRLFRHYWSIPARQVETSVVLAKDGIYPQLD